MTIIKKNNIIFCLTATIIFLSSLALAEEQRTEIYVAEAREVLIDLFRQDKTDTPQFTKALDNFIFWGIDGKFQDNAPGKLSAFDQAIARLPGDITPEPNLIGFLIWLSFDARHDPMDLVRGRSF